jgi:predicted phosphodiesterase
LLILAGGDAHFPHQDKEVIKRFLDEAKHLEPDHVILMGDIMDFARLHKSAQKLPTMDPWREIQKGRRFIRKLRDATNADITWIEGNHDSRPSKTMLRNVPQLASFPSLSIPEIFGLGDLEIDWVGELDPPFDMDGMLWMHGEMIRKHAGMTVTQHILKYDRSVNVGHCHRMALTHARRWKKTLQGVECGCMCTPAAGKYYVRNPDWHPGYVIFEDGVPYLIPGGR